MRAEAGSPESKPCANLVRTFENEVAKFRNNSDNGMGNGRNDPGRLVVDGCKTHGNCNAMEEKIELDE